MREYNIEALGFPEAPLLILALDTTTRTGSVAVLEARAGHDARLRHVGIGDAAITHGERLPADLMRALDQAQAAVHEVGLLAVVAGPGSFTGLRVGIATMQGLAMAQGLRIVPVSALDALAATAMSAAPDAPLIAPWIDAQRGEVFAALWQSDPPRQIAGPSANPPEETLRAIPETEAPPGILFVGDGAIRYREAIQGRFGTRAHVLEPPALAPIAAQIAAAHPERAVAPHAIVPIYVRRPDAELAKEKSR